MLVDSCKHQPPPAPSLQAEARFLARKPLCPTALSLRHSPPSPLPPPPGARRLTHLLLAGRSYVTPVVSGSLLLPRLLLISPSHGSEVQNPIHRALSSLSCAPTLARQLAPPLSPTGIAGFIDQPNFFPSNQADDKFKFFYHSFEFTSSARIKCQGMITDLSHDPFPLCYLHKGNIPGL
ncbi:hypothetical protein U9M48_025504 [Paspalum notatum var. saurae]|uniref:Uncharacterized protein n=1 Tax=Paspalum notatum var. saurae TaxID=547442 RepID=A0AAQ3TPS4_PASNO